MAMRTSFVGFVIAAVGLAAPRAVLAQAHDHAAGAAGAAGPAVHMHTDPVVDCTKLASPPWSGLSDADRAQIAELRSAVSGLTTPEAAEAAGFRPALGDIPGMGVHYVNRQRTMNGVQRDEPDHLLFADVDGKQRLVGVAYAFIDAPDTDEPIPFQSDLAHWHDHPQFAPEGQTLHMLHVWFMPSSNGPFAGLNYWLPFEERGLTPPSACWMADPDMAERIKNVSFALVPRGIQIEQAVVGDSAVADGPEEPTAERKAMLADLDFAARANDLTAWTQAADRLLADLSPAERMRSRMLLRALTNAQMSSAEREAEQGH